MDNDTFLTDGLFKAKKANVGNEKTSKVKPSMSAKGTRSQQISQTEKKGEAGVGQRVKRPEDEFRSNLDDDDLDEEY